MTSSSGMIKFFVKGGLKQAKQFLENVKLIESPALMTYASVPEELRKKLGIDDTLITHKNVSHFDHSNVDNYGSWWIDCCI